MARRKKSRSGLTATGERQELVLPVGEIREGEHLTESIYIKRLTVTQRRGLRRLARGLDNAGETLMRGNRVTVDNSNDAVRYVLERMGQEEAAEQDGPGESKNVQMGGGEQAEANTDGVQF